MSAGLYDEMGDARFSLSRLPRRQAPPGAPRHDTAAGRPRRRAASFLSSHAAMAASCRGGGVLAILLGAFHFEVPVTPLSRGLASEIISRLMPRRICRHFARLLTPRHITAHHAHLARMPR